MPDFLYRGATTPSFDVQRGGFWRLVQPPVYRYLPEKYSKSFFDKGEILLASYKRFSEHKDEARGDLEEGTGVFVSATGEGRTFGAHVVPSKNAYIMCGSFILSKNMMDRFEGCNSAIEIADVHSFALDIANKMSGFLTGTSGYCIYRDERVIYREIKGDPFPLSQDDSPDIAQVFSAAYDAHQGEHYFFKRRTYSYQAEYRLVW